MTSSVEGQTLEIEVQVIRERLLEAGHMTARGAISMSQLGVMTEEIQSRLSITEARLAEIALSRSMPNTVIPELNHDVEPADMEEWMALPIDDRRDFVRRVMNVVFLSHYKGSARVFDRDTVMVIYKLQGSARGPLSANDLANLKKHWIERGILSASGLRTFNHPSPIDGKKRRPPRADVAA